MELYFLEYLNLQKQFMVLKNLRQAILNLSMTNLRTVMGSMDLDELLSKREVLMLGY